MDFSADSSVVAAIESKRQYIDLYDAESGALRTSIPFGVAQAVVLEATPGFSVRFSPEFLVVSGGFGTPDEQTVSALCCAPVKSVRKATGQKQVHFLRVTFLRAGSYLAYGAARHG